MHPDWYQSAPEQALRAVFNPEAMSKIASCRRPSIDLRHRLDVLRASGPFPSDRIAAIRMIYLRAQKAAWETYVESAFVCGMFQGERGRELSSRLTGWDDEGFRSAMAECAACWYLAGPRRFAVRPEGRGRDARKLDLAIAMPDGDIGVEVKAPLEEMGDGFQCYDHSLKLVSCMEQANKQFSADTANVLFVVPTLTPRLFEERHFLVKAFIGQDMITWKIDTRTGGPPPGTEPRNEFRLDGKFTRRTKSGETRFTRVSAVVCMEERTEECYPHPDPFALAGDLSMWREWQRQMARHYSHDNRAWIGHNVLVVHNPFAERPVSASMWEGLIQFIREGDHVRWNDGHGLFF